MVASFAPDLLRRDAPALLVNHGHQAVERVGIAARPLEEKTGDVVGRSFARAVCHSSPARASSDSKRGLPRSGAHVGSTARYAIAFDRSANAFSNQIRVSSTSPSCAIGKAMETGGTYSVEARAINSRSRARALSCSPACASKSASIASACTEESRR